MLEFEVVVMLIGLRSEAYLLDNDLGRIGFLFFLFAFLLVQELLVVQYSAHGRLGIRRDLHQVKVLFVGNLHGLTQGINTLLYIVTHQTNLSHAAYCIIDAVRQFFFNTSALVAWRTG